MIADITVTNDEWIADYASSVHDIVHRRGGRYLARSANMATLEGRPLDTDLIALIEFPSKDAAPSLPDDPHALKAMLLARDAEIERLHQIIKELQRHRFGRRTEGLPDDQLLLALEEVEQVEAEGFAGKNAADPVTREARARKRRANRGSLPAHLPRIEQVIDIVDKTCPCCGGLLHVMGEDVSERVDVAPAQFRVIVNGVDPQAYLADVIARIVAGHSQSQIDDLLPWAYAHQPLKAVA